MLNRHFIVLLTAILGACSSPGGPYPSLRPRAAEAIDPRVPVTRPMNERPVTPALASRLAVLVDEAESGEAAFDGPASEAERLAAAAGAPQSDGWIEAQEALTAAIAARKLTATALADIDEIGGNALQANAGIAPNDLAAIKSAAEQVSALDRRQADRIDAIQKRLRQ
jgi:hypothetical protein